MRWLAIAPVALWASTASAAFHPVEDQPYRYDIVETRTANGATLRFHARRSVVFHRADTGFTAIVTLESIDQQGAGDVGRMFLAATGALLHRALHFRLDAMGIVTQVEGADAAISLIADAIERMDSPDRARSSHSKALANPLRALPVERKAAMLGSILTPVIAAAAADRPLGQNPVTVPGRPPLPSGTGLAGLETVSRSASGIVTIDVRAQGGLDAIAPADTPGASVVKPAAAPTATLHTIRNIDPASGLVRDSRDISEATILDGDTPHTMRIETIVTVTPPAK